MTPAQEAGLVIGRKYHVSTESESRAAGKIVYFNEDDGSDQPWFGEEKGELDYCPKISEVTAVEALPIQNEIPVVKVERVGDNVVLEVKGKLSKDKLQAVLNLVYDN